MNVGIVTPYGNTYANDRLFDKNAWKIGQQLYVPWIKLRERLEELGHSFHTADIYNIEEIDVLIVQDLNHNSKVLLSSFKDYVSYFLKKKSENDFLWKTIKHASKTRRILLIYEPPTVCPQSFDCNYHKLFDTIITWDASCVDEKKYFHYNYPQIEPKKEYKVSFSKKKFLTMICGNKSSKNKCELYSKRKEIIDYLENTTTEFDLYGFGWGKAGYVCYRGTTQDKLETLSKYKYSICFENMYGIKGYITEKIFDCFFSGCIPIYWGAEDITEYIPEGTFIDYRRFNGIEQIISYLQTLTETEYNEYIDRINVYLNSERYRSFFSLDSYVDVLIKHILADT